MGITSSQEQQPPQQKTLNNVDQQQQRYIQQQLAKQQQQQQLQQQVRGQSQPITTSTTTIKGSSYGVTSNSYKPITSYSQQAPNKPSSPIGKSYGGPGTTPTNTPKFISSTGGRTPGPESFNILMSPPSSPLVGPNGLNNLPPIEQAVVPTVFTWTGGGKEVYISGSFNNWKEKLPLSHSERDFTLIYNLPPGVHQYKYIVDGKWLHSTEQPVAADIKGNLLNFVEVKSKDASNDLNTFKLSTTPPGSYSKSIPEEEFQKIPPPSLPPHLRRALLNTAPSTEDPTLLPLPHHVMLNHLYSLPRKDKVTILGVTHRYKTKFVTTVLYKPVNESSLDQI